MASSVKSSDTSSVAIRALYCCGKFGTLQRAQFDPDGQASLQFRKHIVRFRNVKCVNGVVAHAATLLNLRRTTLVEKLRKYGIEREGSEGAPEAALAATFLP